MLVLLVGLKVILPTYFFSNLDMPSLAVVFSMLLLISLLHSHFRGKLGRNVLCNSLPASSHIKISTYQYDSWQTGLLCKFILEDYVELFPPYSLSFWKCVFKSPLKKVINLIKYIFSVLYFVPVVECKNDCNRCVYL